MNSIVHKHNTCNLTNRHCQIMDLLVVGCSLKQAAKELGISRNTVKNHLYNEKYGILTRSNSLSLTEVAYKYGVEKEKR